MADTDPLIAINQSKVANRPDSYESATKAGQKVCITTASHPDLPDGERIGVDLQ